MTHILESDLTGRLAPKTKSALAYAGSLIVSWATGLNSTRPELPML